MSANEGDFTEHALEKKKSPLRICKGQQLQTDFAFDLISHLPQFCCDFTNKGHKLGAFSIWHLDQPIWANFRSKAVSVSFFPPLVLFVFTARLWNHFFIPLSVSSVLCVACWCEERIHSVSPCKCTRKMAEFSIYSTYGRSIFLVPTGHQTSCC